jgi:hypothetical protein
MNSKNLIIGFIFLVLLSTGIEFIFKEKHGGLDTKQVEITETKTYEQGLWDGFNKTMKYLDQIGYIKDTVHIEITKLDSVLHAK